MALETLHEVEEIDGFDIYHIPERALFIPEDKFIFLNHSTNTIAFTVQRGPIKEVGINGCQVDTMIETARLIIKNLNEKFPCKENDDALYYLGHALHSLAERKRNREARGVEGTSQV